MKIINVNVVGEPTDTPWLTVDGRPGTYWADMSVQGRATFKLEDVEPTGLGATISYANGTVRVIVPPQGAWEADLPPVRPPEQQGTLALTYAPKFSRLHAAGDHFADETGKTVVLGLSTDFMLFKLALDGNDTSSLRAGRRNAGSQGARVFGTCAFLFGLDPRDYPDYYGDLTRFARLLAADGEYLHYTAIADGQMLRHGFDQIGHFNRACAALADEPNVVMVEACNENEKNGVYAANWSKPALAPLVSSGSFCDGWRVTGLWGDVVTFHPRRDHKWWYTVPATAQEIRDNPPPYGVAQNRPVWIGEPIGAAEFDEPGRRSSNPALFEKLGAGIGIFAAGGVFHSQAGLTSQPWTNRERECAEAFFRGIHR